VGFVQYSGIGETQTLIQVFWGVTLFCWVVLDVSKGLVIFIFKGDGVVEPPTQQHGVTSQKRIQQQRSENLSPRNTRVYILSACTQ